MPKMKNMKLKDIIKTLVLAGSVLLLTPAAADIPASSEAKHPDSSEDVSSIRQKELDMLRENTDWLTRKPVKRN